MELRRLSIRKELQVDVVVAQEARRFVLTSENVSTRGLCVHGTALPPVGEPMRVSFGLSEPRGTVDAEALVRWIEPATEDRPARAGLELRFLSLGDTEGIARYVEDRDSMYAEGLD